MSVKFENRYGEQVEIKIGTVVFFKCDIEQAGVVVDFCKYNEKAIIENKHGFDGEYIGGQTKTTMDFEDLSVEG
mgnify:CR=1 FL=1